MALAQRSTQSAVREAPAHRPPTFQQIRGALSILLATGLVGAAMFLPVVQSSDATTTGVSIRRHQTELNNLIDQTSLLQGDVAQLSSSARVKAEAARIGMVSTPTRAIAVSVQAPAPAGITMPGTFEPVEQPATATPVEHGFIWNVLHAMSVR